MSLYNIVLFIVLGYIVVYCVLVTIALQLVNKDLERLKDIIINRRLTMEAEKCRKCGNNVFEAKHVGPHIGWYCTKCGAWLRWIPQHNKKAQLNEPHQMSIDEYVERTKPAESSMTDEEKTEAYFGKLPWEE